MDIKVGELVVVSLDHFSKDKSGAELLGIAFLRTRREQSDLGIHSGHRNWWSTWPRLPLRCSEGDLLLASSAEVGRSQ